MEETPTVLDQDRETKRAWVRFAVRALGLAMVAFGVGADFLAGRDELSFGLVQVWMVILGAGVFLAADPAKFRQWFLLASVNLVVAALFLVSLEFGAREIRARLTGDMVEATVPYYADKEWAEAYWKEQNDFRYRYMPYSGWRRAPYQGAAFNVDSLGRRVTPGAECASPDALRVVALGGSTMVGWGAPDWLTIPAFLQAGLSEALGSEVCVINLGEDAYIATQSLVQLVVELNAGLIPDVVVSYQGVNEVGVGFESGRPLTHFHTPTLTDVFMQDDNLIGWLKTRSSLLALLSSVDRRSVATRSRTRFPSPVLTEGSGPDLPDGDLPSNQLAQLGDDIVAAYLRQHDMMCALAEKYGFKVYAFWQPAAFYGRQLTEQEEAMMQERPPGYRDLTRLVYSAMEEEAPQTPDLYSLARSFEGIPEAVYIDAWMHVTPEANRVIAQDMLEIMRQDLASVEAPGRVYPSAP